MTGQGQWGNCKGSTRRTLYEPCPTSGRSPAGREVHPGQGVNTFWNLFSSYGPRGVGGGSQLGRACPEVASAVAWDPQGLGSGRREETGPSSSILSTLLSKLRAVTCFPSVK